MKTRLTALRKIYGKKKVKTQQRIKKLQSPKHQQHLGNDSGPLDIVGNVSVTSVRCCSSCGTWRYFALIWQPHTKMWKTSFWFTIQNMFVTDWWAVQFPTTLNCVNRRISMDGWKQTTDIVKGKCLARWKISKHQERKLKENRKSTNNPTNHPNKNV